MFQDKTTTNLNGRLEIFPDYKYSNNQYIVHIDDSDTNILIVTESFRKFPYLSKVNFLGELNDVRNKLTELHI